ncbi:MAG TPA: Vms1/Ankzf1 family peptidyl-tRNA hydrolase [Pyrinomonadaceae bacterium]
MKELSKDLLLRQMDELTAFEPNGMPFISLYLNAQADQHGRDNFEPFLRREFSGRARTFAEDSPERKGFERARRRIDAYLKEELKPSASGLAIFARAGAGDYFKAVQLEAPIHRNKLHVSAYPHLYPLARLIDQNPRYAALIADTHAARLYVFDLGQTKRSEELVNEGISLPPAAGEWSAMRYRRRTENFQQLHAKQIVEMLDRVMRDEAVKHIVLAGDEVIVPLLRERMPAHLAEKVVDILRLDIRTPEHEVLRAATEALREDNIQTDAEKVRELFDKYRAGSPAAAGVRETLAALARGQVDELLLSAALDAIGMEGEKDTGEANPTSAAAKSTAKVAAPTPGSDADFVGNDPALREMMIADELVSRAHRTGAKVTFIEDRNLLAPFGGAGAFLRYLI